MPEILGPNGKPAGPEYHAKGLGQIAMHACMPNRFFLFVIPESLSGRVAWNTNLPKHQILGFLRAMLNQIEEDNAHAKNDRGPAETTGGA